MGISSTPKLIFSLLVGTVPLVVSTHVKAQMLDSLAFNGMTAIYDTHQQQYFISVPEALRTKTSYRAAVTFKKTSDTDRVFYLGTEIVSGDTLTLPLPLSSTPPAIEVARVEQRVKYPLIGTFLPLVSLTTSPDINGTIYTTGSIRVVDPNTAASDQLFASRLRYRGATAQTMQKKAFAVKLTDAEGNNADGSFFGLRSDNDWILDAMAIDYARMRNRVCFDLWNDFSTKPYHYPKEKKVINGTRGHFVEVILNGRYQGLYCMTEKLDRKQLKLKKYTTTESDTTLKGLLYKSKHWSYAVLMGHNPDSYTFPGTPPADYDNHSDTWQYFEMAYPEVADGEKITWSPLYDAISKVASNDTAAFAREAATLFDLPVALDYYLMMDLILASDNHGKNMYYYVYDLTKSSQIGIAPWDLDGTWGRDYYSRRTYTEPEQDYTAYLWAHEHGELTLFKRLRESPSFRWNERLRERYAALRATHFSPEALTNRFTTYANLFKESGADLRERERWNGANGKRIDIQQDVDYIKYWITKRVDYLDKQYGYDPSGIHISTASSSTSLTVEGRQGSLWLYASQPQNVAIYTLSGCHFATLSLPRSIATTFSLPAGIYLVKGKKVIVY